MIGNRAKTFVKNTDMMTREDWLSARRMGVGGSDASAIMGANPYVSPLKLWRDKMGKEEETETNEAMRQGSDLEQYVADRFTQFMEEAGTPVKVRKVNRMFQSPEYNWMLANIDRDIAGEDAGLECKTTSPYSKFKFDEGEINPHYYWQCMHYMAVTGAGAWYVAVLVLGKAFHVFKIERDEAQIAALIAAEKNFWEEHVEKSVPPLPTGSEEDDAEVLDMYPAAYEGEGEEIADLYGMEDALNLRDMKKQQVDELEKQIREIDQNLKMEMGEHRYGSCGGWKVSWTNLRTERVDTKKLREKYPEIAAECLVASESRRFSVKRVKTQEEA